MKCPICGEEIKDYSNNPSPLKIEEVCDRCNAEVIIPVRYFLANHKSNKFALQVTPDQINLVQPKEEYFSLKELQTSVEGYIEIAPRVIDNCLTVVNEEGLLKGLPFNKLASILFGTKLYGNILIVPDAIFEKPEEE